MIRNDAVISRSSTMPMCARARVLDVACGTVLVPDYLCARRGLVTGIDISPEMIRIAAGKFRPTRSVSSAVTGGGGA